MKRNLLYRVQLISPYTWDSEGRHEVRRTLSKHYSLEKAREAKRKVCGIGKPYHYDEIEIWLDGDRISDNV